MEKGVITKASQDKILEIVKNFVKDQKPIARLGVIIGVKLVFAVLDGKYAEKLPELLKEKIQLFIDAILVENDIEKAIELGVDLVPFIIELLKK